MEAIIAIIVQLVGGGVGGNVIGQLVKKYSLGMTGNSVAGAIGGLAGTWIAGQVPGLEGLVGKMAMATDAAAPAATSMDMGALAGQGLTGLVGGGLLTVIAGIVKSIMMPAK